MKIMLILSIMGTLYKMVLRNLLVKAIDDPDEEWDDLILIMADGVFNYKPNPEPSVRIDKIRSDLVDDNLTPPEKPVKNNINPNL